MAVLLQILYLHSRITPLREFCRASGYRVTVFLFPFLTSDSNSVLILMSGLIILLCDVPSVDQGYPSQVLRAGPVLWSWGQLLYIITASAGYSLFLILLSVLLCVPYVDLHWEWGKILATFAQTSVASDHGIAISFPFEIYNAFSAPTALLLSSLNFFLICVLLVTLILVLNLFVHNYAGTIAAALLVLWQKAVTLTWTGLTRFSPVSWVSLNRINVSGSTLYPSFLYIYIVILISIALLGGCALQGMRFRN
jgi:hypothetical protein